MRTTITPALALISVVFAPLVSYAAPFDGTFVGGEGERIILRQQGAKVSGTITTGGTTMALAGTVRGRSLQAKARMPTGESLAFVARLAARGLVVRVAGEESVYHRQGSGAAAPTPATGPRTPAVAAGPAPATRAPALAGPSASDTTYRADYEGWGLHVPPGWKYARREDALIIASDTEAGMIVAEATSVTDPAALARELSSSLAELGTFPQIPPPQGISLPTGRGISSEVQGKAKDGTPIRVRAVGIIRKEGTVTLLGITSTDPKKFNLLRARVDALAKAVFFFKPKVSPARGVIAGEWYSYSGGSTLSGGGGSESVLSFCPDGSYRSSYESGYSGGAGTSGAWGAAGQSGGAGRWRVEGSGSRGAVIVTRANGSSIRIPYRVQGRSVVWFNGRKHARMGRKRCR